MTPQKPHSLAGDAVFEAEQQHLSQTCDTLETMAHHIEAAMVHAQKQAAVDKRSMAEDLSPNLATYTDAMETYADFEAMNRVVDGYNHIQDANAQKLATIGFLLKQPYFAKIALRFKPGQEPKELYIGNAGISDEDYRRLVVDWRSPVAEVYYNQESGATSYVADGRTINVDLLLRRQFDIEGRTLKSYFDTSVAIQDSLLLASLSKRRSAHMQAITATIQKEQNTVVRHEDVPVLLVHGIAGSGKTSVLLQRIAYLFYRHRETLDAKDVFLISPNPVFSRYIDRVLPDLGEANPETITWDEFVHDLLPAGVGSGKANVDAALLARIDDAAAQCTIEQGDFKDIVCKGVRLVSANQIAGIAAKFKHVPAGPHLVTLIREEIAERLQNRLKSMAGSDDVHDEVAALEMDEQLRIFHETIDPQDEAEEQAYALTYVHDRYAQAFDAVEHDEWLRIDRIAARTIGPETLSPVAWLYLKMALTGLSNAQARYVFIDEVQDYTLAQLAVMARYFRRAHFLLLGDKNQAIVAGTASFDEIRALFEKTHGDVHTCDLMTSYRSTPEITTLFAQILSDDERLRISSIHREGAQPAIEEYRNRNAYEQALRNAVAQAEEADGLTAVIVPYKHMAKQLRSVLADSMPAIIDDASSLPERGIAVVPLKYAKGLEFDRVIVPDASQSVFPDNPLSRRCLYTTISRATRAIRILSSGTMTSLIQQERTS